MKVSHFFSLFFLNSFWSVSHLSNMDCHAKQGMWIFEWQIIIFQNYGFELQYLQVFKFAISCYLYILLFKEAVYQITNLNLRQTYYLILWNILTLFVAIVFYRRSWLHPNFSNIHLSYLYFLSLIINNCLLLFEGIFQFFVSF